MDAASVNPTAGDDKTTGGAEPIGAPATPPTVPSKPQPNAEVITLDMEDEDEQQQDWSQRMTLPRKVYNATPTGFYKSRNEAPGGYHPVLLALEVPGAFPPQVSEIRPLTGVKQTTMLVSRLEERYVKIDLAQARKLWCGMYDKGSVKGGVSRVRHHFLLSGLILPVWGAVAGVISQMKKPRD